MYSQEEIEKKRQAAIQLKQQKASSNVSNSNSSTKSGAVSDGTKIFNNPNPFPQPLFKENNLKNNLWKQPSSYKQQSTNNRYNPIANNKFNGNQQNTANRHSPTASNKFYGTQQNQQHCEAACSLISNSRFAVEMSNYNQQLIEVFKTIPTRIYDIKTKIWNFHIVDYDMVASKVCELRSEVAFKGLPAFIQKIVKTKNSKENTNKPYIDLSKLDEVLRKSLYQFQIEGIEYGILKDGKCLIADDMGLGKTRQALGIAQYFSNDWPILIITPSSVRYQWSEAIYESLPSVQVQSIQHVVTKNDIIEKSQVTILSYDLVIRRIDELVSRKFGIIICDETHYLKSAKTQRTQAVQRLSACAKRIILLTGTPALSRPIELYSQIKLLVPSFMSLHDFGVRYCAAHQVSYGGNRSGWNYSGSSNLKELEIVLKEACLIRRLKTEVLKQLPSKIRQKVILDPYLIKAATKDMEEASKKLEKKNMNGMQKHNALLEYYHETSKAKEKAVCNYIGDLLERQQKFLVFAHHQSMMDAICDLLHSKKIFFIRIDGKTNPEQRKNFVDSFQQNDEVLVAVLSITAANAGLNLTAAKLVLFAELSWNPGILAQAEDRVHRIGQEDNVVIRYLLAKGTADDHLWAKLQTKTEILNEAGLEQNFDLGKADMSEQTTSSKQQSLDNFLEISPHKNSQNLAVAPENSDLQTSTDSFKDLLDIDDDAFNEIDLDNIV